MSKSATEKQVRLLIEYHQQIADNCKIYGRGTELALAGWIRVERLNEVVLLSQPFSLVLK